MLNNPLNELLELAREIKSKSLLIQVEANKIEKRREVTLSEAFAPLRIERKGKKIYSLAGDVEKLTLALMQRMKK